MDEEQFKQAVRGARPATRGWRCPSDEDLAGYVDRRLEANRCVGVERHLAGCGYCREQAAALVRLAEQPLPTVPADLLARAAGFVPDRPPKSLRIPRWAMAAAAACLIVAAVPLLRQGHRPPVADPPAVTAPSAPAPSVPSAPPSEPPITKRSAAQSAPLALEFPQEGATLSSPNLELRWNAAPDSLSYEVSVLNTAGDVMWHQQSEGTHVRLPASLAPGKYYVSVSARLPDGKTTRSSPVGFQLASGN
jgi:hypothetical protein